MGNGARTGKTTAGARLRYRIDNFMARGGLAVFFAILSMFAIGFLAAAILRLVAGLIAPDQSAPAPADGLWRTFIEIADAGNIGDDSDAPWLSKLVGIATIFVGMVLFSSMVAFITSLFQDKLDALRRGKSGVIENGHTLILGFGDRLVDIVREVIVANESEADAAVVVLADRDKQEMDECFNERIPDRKTTRLITRSGSPSHVDTLRKVAVERARSITVLSDARSSDAAEQKSLADARVLKNVMAVVAACGERDLPPIVAELFMEKNRTLAESIAPGRITTLAEESLLSKMLVQTSRVSGLALVYSDLVGFEGNEIYFYRPESGWSEIAFGQLLYHFVESVPLGLRHADGQIALNPPRDLALRPDDDVIVLAEDDSTIGFSRSPLHTPAALQPTQLRLEPRPERHLVVGWTGKSKLIIGEYAQYLKPGSAIHVVVEQEPAALAAEIEPLRQRFPEIKIGLAQVDISAPEALARLAPHGYGNVIILSRDQATPEEADATTISTLLRFRQHFKAHEQATGSQVTTQVITEVMDSDNADLVLQVGVRDYLVSNQFVSKIFAQVAQEPDVKRVYDDLFQEQGSEIYLKPAALYFPQLPVTLPFGDCVAAAQLRGEICFGYRLAVDAADAARGHGIHIIPNKCQPVTLGAGDFLITLAEDES
ncbi:MAG: hypothetical protein JXR83_19655 [Deltaproteobacteria bacterium]|nr:hypothetical protein [Deltaproteobacteria bacterium]